MKSGMTMEGKKPQLKMNIISDKGPKTGDEPTDPNRRSEIADGVRRKSEEIARLSSLRAV
jgi:hypothetical protein